VRAKLRNEPQLAAAIAEQHEIFAEQPHAFGVTVLELFDRGNRMPVAALEFAHRRPRADARQLLVFLRR